MANKTLAEKSSTGVDFGIWSGLSQKVVAKVVVAKTQPSSNNNIGREKEKKKIITFFF